jgi:nucleoside 2-deoxyribosyltransferase
MPDATCPVCDSPATAALKEVGRVVDCRRCGNFILVNVARSTLSNLSPAQTGNLSGWIRENQGCTITEQRLEELKQLKSPTVGEKGDKLLLFLAAKFPKPGEEFELGYTDAASREASGCLSLVDIYGIVWAEDFAELRFLLVDYLMREKGALLNRSSTDALSKVSITPKGWSQVAALRQSNVQSDRGFVAMWFDESMNATDAAIGAAIRDAGYRDLRIDRLQHNNRIDDEIIVAIRRSKFVVADFTGQRGGVYFEAGFALGLGIPVIWTCRKDDLAKIHFDNRQYNFILWEADKLGELQTALRYRIEATIGAGPNQQAP